MPRFKAVALDMMGVVYPVADDLRDLIVPFLRSEGCDQPDAVFIDAYRRCYRRGAAASTFWQDLGYSTPPEELESRLLGQYTLTAGAVAFLQKLDDNQIPVFSLSNDVAGWAAARRKLLGIDRYFRGAVISGEIGIPKPEPGIYRALAQKLPCPTSECLFVDDRAANLRAAEALGFATALFGGSSAEAASVASFDDLARYLAL